MIARRQKTTVKLGLPECMAIISFLGALLFGQMLLTSIGLAAAAYSAGWYLRALGDEIAVVPLVALVATAQWVLGPAIAYSTPTTDTRYIMYVPQDQYMDFVVPAVLVFLAPLRIYSREIKIADISTSILGRRRIRNTAVFGIIALGLFCSTFSSIFPPSLDFLFFILSQFQFVGALYLVVRKVPYRWAVAGGVLLHAAIVSSQSGMFHDLILWTTFFLTFLCYDFRLDLLRKAVLVTAGVLVLISLQQVKAEYRDLLRWQPESAGVVRLGTAMLNVLWNGRTTTSEGATLARLNEGWIISAVMAHTPTGEPFANGETIGNAVKASLLPRFLFEKEVVNQSDTFTRFTGMQVGDNTTFGISIVGEAWANFGMYGIAFMFVWGMLLALVIRYIRYQSQWWPTLSLWTPLIFFHVVKAETEMTVVLNYLVKSMIVVFIFYYAARRILKAQI
jgi:hypothetical protein